MYFCILLQQEQPGPAAPTRIRNFQATAAYAVSTRTTGVDVLYERKSSSRVASSPTKYIDDAADVITSAV